MTNIFKKAEKIPMKRVGIDLAPSAVNRLESLKSKTEAASYAEVIKNALRLYEALIEEAEKGNSFSLKTPDGKSLPFKMFL